MIADDGHRTTTITIDLRKLRLASQEKMIENMNIAAADIKAAIEMSQVPAGRRTSPGRDSSRSLS
jgi:hypothetical protein